MTQLEQVYSFDVHLPSLEYCFPAEINLMFEQGGCLGLISGLSIYITVFLIYLVFAVLAFMLC